MLERSVDLPAPGWLSGDDHIHIDRPTPAGNAPILAFMRAEGLHGANLLQMGNLRGSYFKQYRFGQPGHAPPHPRSAGGKVSERVGGVARVDSDAGG